MPYVPRTSITSPTVMQDNPWWYSSGNIYYPTYGLPNCTCYCYGRVGEYSGAFDTRLPGGNGGQWWPNAAAAGILPMGQEPALGAIACYADLNGNYLGHVSIVEEIDSAGYIRTSNSGWPSTYFWYSNWLTPGDYTEPWMHQPGSSGLPRDYYCQGFIYVYELPPTPGGSDDDYYMLWLQNERLKKKWS